MFRFFTTKKTQISFFLLFFSCLMFFSTPLLANELKSFAGHYQGDEYITLEAGQTIKGPIFYGGKIVKIDGNIDGTAFIAAQEIRINGEINGDLIAAAQQIIISGKVEGNTYSASQDLLISGTIKGDALGFAQKTETSREALIQRDALMAAEKIVHQGEINRQLLAFGNEIRIDGKVSDDIKLGVENLTILDKAEVGGNLLYASENKALLSSKAQVKGRTNWEKVALSQYREVNKKEEYQDNIMGIIIGLAGALLIWFLIRIWRPRLWTETIKPIKEQPIKTLGLGALALILTPIVAIIFMVTVIGMPLGIILALVYGVFLYLAKIVVAVFLGYSLARYFSWPELHKGVWLTLLGLSLLALLTKLPYVGFLTQILIIFAGLGALIMYYLKPTPGETDLNN